MKIHNQPIYSFVNKRDWEGGFTFKSVVLKCKDNHLLFSIYFILPIRDDLLISFPHNEFNRFIHQVF